MTKPKSPKKYCYSCGTLLKAKVGSTTYNEDTGKPDYYWIYFCPNNLKKPWWRFWQEHDITEPYPDLVC
ncbi:hypothetical protein CMO96_05030 [Candidatus Woesebacteria bacterium]|nr:hypothetical protein [Candidatus Woesebacteria bacterium]|tara:strand:+ start:155 stop:361 length:207 start_codon:yes stop_codon:yes gene_type:complete